MKKIPIIILIVLLLLTTTVLAEEQFVCAGDLWQNWQMNAGDYYTECPYPDGISGAWSTDGGMTNLTFGITDNAAGEAAKNAVLSQIKDKDTVSFVYHKFSYEELWEVRLEIEKSLGADNGMVGIGIYENENRIHIDMDKDHKATQNTVKELSEKYPEMLAFELGGPAVVTSEEILDNNKAGYNFLLFVLLAAVVCAVILTVFRKKIFMHSDGTVSQTDELSVGRVKQLVKSADITPTKDILKKIDDMTR